MKVSEMIEALQKLPQDAEVFECAHYGAAPDGLEMFALYEREPVYYAEVWSCRSSLPSAREKMKNVVVMEAT